MAILARGGGNQEKERERRPAGQLAQSLRETLACLYDGMTAGMIEMRAIRVYRAQTNSHHTETNLYANDEFGRERLIKDAAGLDGRAEGIYVTLNPVSGTVGSDAAKDKDIIRRRWLLIDIDPRRPEGASATEEEKQQAFAAGRLVREWLGEAGVGDVVLADSGNGCHLLARIDLPNDDGSKRLVQGVLKAIARRFDTPRARIDTTVYNAGRITKLYGTTACKGEPTDDRPHRRSLILEQFWPMLTIPKEILRRIADDGQGEPAPEPPGKPTNPKGIIARDLGDSPEQVYAHKALLAELDLVAAARPGTRNNQLYKSACNLFELCAAGALNEFETWRGLADSARSCELPDDEIDRTIRSAFDRCGDKSRDLSHVGKEKAGGVETKELNPKKVRIENAQGIKENLDDPHRLARAFIGRFYDHEEGPRLRYWNEEWHEWIDLCWRIRSPNEINAELAKFIKGEFDARATEDGKTPPGVGTRLVGNVAQALRGELLLPLHRFPEQPTWIRGSHPVEPCECISTRSGIVHLPTLLDRGPRGMGSVIPPTPDFFSPLTLAYEFDPDAPPPIDWLGFLDSVWPDDPESINCLQEWLGYLITQDTSQQKILLMVGPRRSGKGTIAGTIRSLIGGRNVAAPTLSSLGGQFGSQPLIGKQVALCTESRLTGRSDSQAIVERLLSISGEDPQSVERKRIEDWHGLLRTRFVLQSNELPRLGDYSSALPSRLIVLKMTNSFLGREDRQLKEKIAAEMPGILLWAIAGWGRLRERGYFLQPESGEELIREFEEINNPIGLFASERCRLDPQATCTIKRLYEGWKEWCERNGRGQPGDLPGFARNLRTAFGQVQVVRKQMNDSRARYFVGIDLLPEAF